MGVKVKWRAQKSAWYVLTDHDGKRAAASFGKDKEAAREAAKEIVKAIKLGNFSIKPKAERITLRKFGEERLASSRHRKEVTRKGYLCRFNVHIEPALGSKYLDEITRDDVFAFAEDLLKAKHKINHVRTIISTLRALLGEAVTLKHIASNPAAKLGKRWGKTVSEKVEALSREQLSELLDAWQADYGRELYTFFLCMARTGVRINECIGLQWADIEFDRKRIHVKRTIAGTEWTTPKSNKARYVDMSEGLAEALKLHKGLAKDRGANALVFMPLRGKRIQYRHTLAQWDQVIKTLKLTEGRITPHILRHTFASQLLAAGKSIPYVSLQLGHASPDITMRVYGHFIPTNEAPGVNALDEQPSEKAQPPRNLHLVGDGQKSTKTA